MGNKAGFDDDKLFDIAEIEMDSLGSAPATPPSGQAKLYIKNGVAHRINDAGEERNLEDTGAGTTEGRSYLVSFSLAGNATNKWLSKGNSNESTDTVPWASGFNQDCIGLVYINKTLLTDIDLEFYVNGITATELVYTESIRDKQLFFRTQNSAIFALDVGDTLHIFARKVTPGTDPNSIELDVVVRVRDDTVGTGGS